MLAELAGLWDQAVRRRRADRRQRPTQKELAQGSEVPLTTVNSWATGKSLPRDLDQLATVGRTLAVWAGEKPPPVREWDDLLRADQAVRGVAAGGGDEGLAGRLIAELTDPFALEVHRPVIIGPGGEGLPVLPPYVRRPHDEELGRVVHQAAGGLSGMVVLVGGSSTGKTRACWEAVHLLPADWRLWHPFDPTRPEAVLADLPRVGRQTVVWLNETQLYLNTPGDTGERVAAALQTLLTNPGRAPVLVLGTLWPAHWDALTRDQAAHPQVRTVLAGTDITVPAAFTGQALQDLQRAAADARLAQAAQHAQDGQVTQYLAGVPELLARYRNAEPATRALIHAAMDARRLGHGLALPHALLASAAPAYLSNAEWDAAGDDWLEQALAYTAAPCKGVPGPLTRIRPRPARSRRIQPVPGNGDDHPVTSQTKNIGGPVYRLADYLDQHGRRHRATEIPPAGFWAAVADHAHPGNQAALAGAAHARGLNRDAAQLRKHAAARGNPSAAASLVTSMHHLHPADHRAADWATKHAELSDPFAVAVLLGRLRAVGADQQVSTLVDRDPAGHADLSDPRAVVFLLDSMRAAGADQQISTLADRAARHADLSNTSAVADLLGHLRQVGADQQVSTLADRAARHADLSHPRVVAVLLDRLRAVGADQQVSTLVDRDPAGHADLRDPSAVADLLGRLRAVGADQQVSTLLDRDPAGHADLSDPSAVAFLLDRLRQVGADQQVSTLADRAAGHADLSDLSAVADLLGCLRQAGADQQISTLADRAAGHADLSDLSAVADLLGRLRAAGADQQISTLADRLPAAGWFGYFHEYFESRFRFGREQDGRPAEPWDWDDLD